MRIISRKRLVDFWESRASDSEVAERDLSAWYKIAKGAEWPQFAAVKQTFGSADRVGNCIVFDVGNNRFRLIARLSKDAHTLYILKVMDHQEYDRNRWPDECGCHRPPPAPPGNPKRPPVRKGPSKPAPRERKKR